MSLDLTTVRVIVYDLDGTVYDDTRHFDLYAREIQSHLPESVQEAFWADYTAVLGSGHPALQIGTFYDREKDLVLKPRAGKIVHALHWDGSEVPDGEREQLYPGTVAPDQGRIVNVGDLWWVPTTISSHYGGSREKHGECFLKIRDVMAGDSFAMDPIPQLRETVLALKGKVVQVLATNSPQPDSEAILSKVGLLGLLDRHYFRSNKPAGLLPIFLELSELYGAQLGQILSIGDNLVNEIAPARAMGCQTVFIDPHSLGEEDDADLIVPSMRELIPILRAGF